MLMSLRQRQRQYEADVYAAIQEQGGSEHYDGLTPTKCRAAESWIEDAILPTGDRPFDIEPTPIPDISPEVKNTIRQQAMSAAVQQAVKAQALGLVQADGAMMADVMEMVAEYVEDVYQEVAQEEADEKAKKMARKIDDQFQEGHFYTEIKAFIRDFVTFPAAFLMGPVFRRRRRSKYVQMNGKWMPQVAYEAIPEYERVSPFDVYPEDDAKDTQDGDLFVRKRISASELASFKGSPGYDAAAIDAVLQTYGEGGLRNWTTIDQARSNAEGRQGNLYESNKIDMLRFWGCVRGSFLLEYVDARGTGLNTENIQPNEYYDIDAIKIGQYIIRAILNPDKLGRKPISKACYEEVPGSFWGNGVPDLIRHDQYAVNAVARAIANNSALSSGPIVEFNMDRLSGESDRRIVPWMQILSTEDQMASGAPAVHFTHVPNNTDQMLQVWERFLTRADENSGVPAYAHGSEDVGGAGDTASGLSMLMSSSSKLLRMAIYNMDVGVIEPTVERQFHYNMLFLEDESIKGDLRAVPKGATVLLIREQMAARQGEFADSTNNPVDYPLMGPEGRKALRRAQARNLNLDADDLFPDNSVQSQAQMPGQQQAPTTNTQGGVPQGRSLDAGGRPRMDYQRQ